MLMGKVIGTAVSTVKHPSMEGCKLLVVQPTMADGITADGYPLVAIDKIGAGAGETVMITSDGAGTRNMLNVDATPVRWSILGIADHAAN